MMTRRRTTTTAPVTETRRCAIYTRKSTSAGLEQEFNSLDAQKEACEAYIQRQPGWVVVPDNYDDGGFTGSNTDRPAFQRLLEDVEAGKIDIVVVYKVDRLSRSLLDFAQVMDRLNRSGAAFVSVTQNFSTADAMGRLTLNMLMSFAEFEREMIAERTRDKIAASRRKGKWTGGTVPLGYDVVDKKLVVNDLEADVVREAFQLYLQHRSALAVARELNRTDRLTKHRRAKSGATRHGKAWGKDSVLRLLRTPLYAGLISSDGELYDGEHDALIDRATYDEAQEHLDAAMGSQSAPGRNPDYILRGRLFCARCGHAFSTASTRRGSQEYRYYRCVKTVKEGQESCGSKPLPADAIEEFVVQQIRTGLVNRNLAADITAVVRARVQVRKAAMETVRRDLPRKIGQFSADGRRISVALLDAAPEARRFLDEELRRVNAELAAHERRLADAERDLAAIEQLEVEASWVARALEDFDAVWDVLTPDNRGRLVRAVVDRVEIEEDGRGITMRLADLHAGQGGEDDPGTTTTEATAC